MEDMDIGAKRRAASLSSKRFANFEPEIDGRLQYPTVVLIRKRDLVLTRFPVPTGEDIFQWDEGHFEISAPA
jgi:hypothetical protein